MRSLQLPSTQRVRVWIGAVVRGIVDDVADSADVVVLSARVAAGAEAGGVVGHVAGVGLGAVAAAAGAA